MMHKSLLGRGEHTLGDLIDNVKKRDELDNRVAEKRHTFDEWWENVGHSYDLTWKARFMDCWNAARK